MQQTNASNQYSKARPLDVHTWSDFGEVNTFVDKIYMQLSDIEGNQRINKRLLKVILLDLYVAWNTDPELNIMFSRDNNSFNAKSRYNEIHIGKKMIGIVDTLISNGFVGQKIGFNDRISGTAFQSRLWATDKLIELFALARFNVFHLHSHEGRETVVLRDENKKPIDRYEDSPIALETRSLLNDYNAILERTHVDISILEKPIIEIGSGKKKIQLPINQRDKFVRRIFNKSRWDKGGRFYGGWWQRCPKLYREFITMDGCPTVEIDFSGLHIVLLYALEEIDYWSYVNDDPYTIARPNNLDPEIDLRKTVKLLLLTTINASTEKEAFAAFRQQCESYSAEKHLTDNQLSSILSTLRHKHEPIAHKLASGAGIDLMFIDSQITAQIIERFTYVYKCPILCIHDSYIVPFGYDRILEKEMMVAFEAVTGQSMPKVKHTTDYYDKIEAEPTRSPPHKTVDEPMNQCELRLEADLTLFRQVYNKPIREPWVPDWTYVF